MRISVFISRYHSQLVSEPAGMGSPQLGRPQDRVKHSGEQQHDCPEG